MNDQDGRPDALCICRRLGYGLLLLLPTAAAAQPDPAGSSPEQLEQYRSGRFAECGAGPATDATTRWIRARCLQLADATPAAAEAFAALAQDPVLSAQRRAIAASTARALDFARTRNWLACGQEFDRGARLPSDVPQGWVARWGQAQCLEQAGQREQAVVAYQAVRDAVDAHPVKRQEAVAALARLAATKSGSQEPPPPPQSGELCIDSPRVTGRITLERTPRGEFQPGSPTCLKLAPGSYQLELDVAGQALFSRQVAVEADRVRRLRAEPTRRSRWWLVPAVGAGLGLLAAGTGRGLGWHGEQGLDEAESPTELDEAHGEVRLGRGFWYGGLGVAAAAGLVTAAGLWWQWRAGPLPLAVEEAD